MLDFEGLGLDFLTKGLENSVWVLESLDFSVKSARIKSDVFIFCPNRERYVDIACVCVWNRSEQPR